ncbi:hypothetical protein GGI23_007638, partial [Coemansia sp. RSA 2559]
MNSLPANNVRGVSGSPGMLSGVRESDAIHASTGFAGYHTEIHGQQSADRNAGSEYTAISTSLLNPHPIIIPPPGSRLAFPGATSREMTHTFRSLPALEDTLLRRAREPLCLYNYWEYLVDVEGRSVELEFWLSLSDYEVLYRRFANLRSPSIGPVSGDNVHEGPRMRTMGPTAKRLRYGRVESGALGVQSVNEAMSSSVGSGGAGGNVTLAKRKSGPIDNLDIEAQELDAYLATLSYQTVLAAKNSSCQAHSQCSSSHRPFTSAHVTRRPTLDTPVVSRRRNGLRGFFSRIFSGEPEKREGAPAGVQYDETSETHQEVPLLAPQTERGDSKDEELLDAPTEEEMRSAAE